MASVVAAVVGGTYISSSVSLGLCFRDKLHEGLFTVVPRPLLGAILLSELITTVLLWAALGASWPDPNSAFVLVLLGYAVLLVWLGVATQGFKNKRLAVWLFLLWVLFAACFTAAAAVFEAQTSKPLHKRFVWSHALHRVVADGFFHIAYVVQRKTNQNGGSAGVLEMRQLT